MKIMKTIAAIAVFTCVLSCNVAQREEYDAIFEQTNGLCSTATCVIPEITATFGPQTRTSYTYSDKRLNVAWSAGDVISVAPAFYSQYAGTYEITEENLAQNKFTVQAGITATSSKYGVYYPGNTIKNDLQFMNFSYEGQVQSKADPTAHIASFHSARAVVSDYTAIDFSEAKQSSCLHLALSGMSFDSPRKITVTALNDGEKESVFYMNNYMSSWYGDSGYSYDGLLSSSTLSLELDGYGSENSLEAFIMMSCADVTLEAGSVLRVHVICGSTAYSADVSIDSEMTLSGGYCHNLTIDSGWTTLPGDYTDYAYDGEVVTLQTASVGNGADIVILGDGFINDDFVSGTYDAIMRQAYQEFFTVQPYSSFNNRFNVYYVKGVSPERLNATNTGANGATNSGSETKFSVSFTENSTAVDGDSDTVIEYAKKALGTNADERIQNALVIVMANQECRAGTCHMSWQSNISTDYGQVFSIAYCALGTSNDERIQLIHHEAGGHGFGILADEYSYVSMSIITESVWEQLDERHEKGIFRNVDKYVDNVLYATYFGKYDKTDKSNVYWSDLFGTANNYESDDVEALGVFKGALTYSYGFCRPTEDGTCSIMNENTGIFNAICRRQIIYRIKQLSGEYSGNIWGTSNELNDFLSWDASVFIPTLEDQTKAGAAEYTGELDSAPVIHEGRWENGVFVEK